MRHRKPKRMPGTSAEHRESLIRNQVIALIEHGKITTTLAKAKVVQPHVEKIITLGRVDTVHNRRMALSKLHSKDAMRKLFALAPDQFATRSSGYSRITKLGPRRGDGAEMAQIELLA